MLTKLILIKTKDGDSYWTDKFITEGNFIVFTTTAKSGATFKHKVHMDNVTEILEPQNGTETEEA